MSLTKEQLKTRLGYLTGSDASVVCGVSPYTNRIELWQYKTGQIAQEPIAPQLEEKGTFLEPAIRKWFEHKTGKKVDILEDMIVSDSHPFMAGHVDGVIDGKYIFEAKTSIFREGWGEQGIFEIPDNYLCQVAHYCSLKDEYEGAWIAVLIGNHDLRWYFYERDYRLEKRIIELETQFWELVQSVTPPEPHSGKEVISLYGRSVSESRTNSNVEIDLKLDELREVKATLKNFTKRKEKIEDAIKVHLGQSQYLYDLAGNLVVTWKANKNGIRTFKLMEQK